MVGAEASREYIDGVLANYSIGAKSDSGASPPEWARGYREVSPNRDGRLVILDATIPLEDVRAIHTDFSAN